MPDYNPTKNLGKLAEEMQEYKSGVGPIMAAAIRTGEGKIYTLMPPNRHHDILHSMPEEHRLGTEQGFVDLDANFLSRKEAADAALRAGQIVKLGWPPDLYSEDLW